MGAGQSKAGDTSNHVFTNDTPIQFSQDLVNHLSDNLASPQTDPVRQSTLDAHVRSRIQAELTRLHAEEAQVREQIEQALEKENLDREVDLSARDSHSSSGGHDAEGDAAAPTSSAALKAELEQVQKRAERFITRKQMEDLPEVKIKRDALIECYRSHKGRPLDCWREVSEFKSSVAVVEKRFVDSLR